MKQIATQDAEGGCHKVPFLAALMLLGSLLSWLLLAVSIFTVVAYSAPGTAVQGSVASDSWLR